jgi:hypothetical protein
VIDALFVRNWWTWRAADDSWASRSYHWFNLAEGCVWLALAFLVLLRLRRFRRSPLECLYAAAFFTFGLSDFREAWSLDSWLIWLKLVNLVALLWLRRTVLRGWYPDSRTF